MPGQGHDALDLRVPIDVVSSATTRQEPSVLFEPALDSPSGGVHACRYLHEWPTECQPVRPPHQDTVDLASDRIQAALAGKARSREGYLPCPRLASLPASPASAPERTRPWPASLPGTGSIEHQPINLNNLSAISSVLFREVFRAILSDNIGLWRTISSFEISCQIGKIRVSPETSSDERPSSSF